MTDEFRSALPTILKHESKLFKKFRQKYKDLVVDHEYSLYALGTIESDGFASKTSSREFEKVCQENPDCQAVDPLDYGLLDTHCTYNLDEPSIAIGSQVRSYFAQRFERLGVKVVLETKVLAVENYELQQEGTPSATKHIRTVHLGQSLNKSFVSDVVVNCTGFEDLVPRDSWLHSSFDFEFIYQACLALRFRDNAPTSTKPMSLIFMDGWFPCLMPAISNINSGAPQQDYILTHGAYTILGSFECPQKARLLLDEYLDDALVDAMARVPAEAEMRRFWPAFSDRFTYEGWYGGVLAKPKCPTEFRSGFAFQYDGVVHVFPGKISNVIDVGEEVLTLLGLGSTGIRVLEQDGCRYVENGIFHQGQEELQKMNKRTDRSTSNLQTFRDVLGA
ncbi:hypothetical protein EJ05DRAFT_500067 [Pseudovirgaria hyperparasitica]|uniref:FAD/NAD(P)-binding domain-containing protein n=1 Tax=Pseudovirgaria hyperparasitica TaxID=470096 RepID=A0A6A6W6N9_9PEZI|nr:uncharacterized protein EJ05DRAFT_500067 [Pseudovirgaria hyperparasitica]KAF2758548.1 hypothetical protein EJ05DRAFT_500067 [Pseudovirgaria hyperparasitica]